MLQMQNVIPARWEWLYNRNNITWYHGKAEGIPSSSGASSSDPAAGSWLFGVLPELHLAPRSRWAADHRVASRQPPPAWDDHRRESLEPNPCSDLRGKPPLRDRPSMRLCPESGDLKGERDSQPQTFNNTVRPKGGKQAPRKPCRKLQSCPAGTSPVPCASLSLGPFPEPLWLSPPPLPNPLKPALATPQDLGQKTDTNSSPSPQRNC